MSIELLPDAINFGKNSRSLLSANVMPLINAALQKVMLQLPSNPAYHVAEYLRENNPARGSRMVEVAIPALFMSQEDAALLASGAVRMDAFESSMRRRRPGSRTTMMASSSPRSKKQHHDDEGAATKKMADQKGGADDDNVSNHGEEAQDEDEEEQDEELKHQQHQETGDGDEAPTIPVAAATVAPSKSVAFSIGGEVVPARKKSIDNSDDAMVTAAATAGAPRKRAAPEHKPAATTNDDDDNNNSVAGSTASEITVRFSGRETDGVSAAIKQCGGLPVWIVEPPLLQELPRVWQRLQDRIWKFEHEQRHQQQHDMHALELQKLLEEQALLATTKQQQKAEEEEKKRAAAKKSSHHHHSRKKSDLKEDEEEADARKKQQATATAPMPNPHRRRPIKVHWIVAGSSDVQVFVGGIPMRARLSQDLCDAAQRFTHDLSTMTVGASASLPSASVSAQPPAAASATATVVVDDVSMLMSSSSRFAAAPPAAAAGEGETAARAAPADNSKDDIFLLSMRSDSSASLLKPNIGLEETASENQQQEQQPEVSISTADRLEATVIRALQAGGRLRASVQQRFRTIVSYEAAIAEAASQVVMNTTSPPAFVASSSSIPDDASSSSSSSPDFAVHRINEYNDVTISEQTVERLNRICDTVAAERSAGIVSVIAFVSCDKSSYINSIAEFATAFFLQRQRALHSDRVGFAIANERVVREMMQVLPIKEHEKALVRRRARDDRRAFLAAEQARYLRTNGLTESPETAQLVADRSAERRTRRERSDAVALEKTNSHVVAAATRIQMCFKGHAAWKSLLQGRGHDVERFTADIPDPALLRVVTEHLRDSLGSDIVAERTAPRPTAPMLQTRKLRLVRYHRIPRHEKLRDLDVSSEDEEWYDVDQVRSSESNIESAMQAVQAACRPWDDVATICRWCGEDGVLERGCELSEQFTGRCSLEVRLLQDFERLSYLTVYDVYCYLLWRDRTAVNRSIRSVSPVTVVPAMPSPSGSIHSSSSSYKQRQQQQQLIFSQFLETCCSKVCVLLSSPQWAVSTAIGNHKPWTPNALAMSSTDTVATSSNANRERKRTGTVLGGTAESTMFSGDPSSPHNKQNRHSSNHSAHRRRLLRASATTPLPNGQQSHPQHPCESPFARRTVFAASGGGGEATQPRSLFRSSTPQVPVQLTLNVNSDNNKNGDNRGGGGDTVGTFQHRAVASEGERSSEFGLNVNEHGAGVAGVGGNNNNNKNNPDPHQQDQREQRAIRLDPRLTQVEQPIPDMPFFFVSEAMPMKAVFDTSRSLFANGDSIGGNIKGVVWVSTVPEPLLYVEEDEVVTLAGRPAHATFELNDLFPKGLFRGYDEVPPIPMKVTGTTNTGSGSSSKGSSVDGGGGGGNSNKNNKNNTDNAKTKSGSSVTGGADAESCLSGSTMTGGKKSTAVPGGNSSNVSASTLHQQHHPQQQQHHSKFSVKSSSSTNVHEHRTLSSSSLRAAALSAQPPPPPDPYSPAFWLEQERLFQDRVNVQLMRWHGVLFLFGTKQYSEVSDLNGVFGASKPSRTRCTFWYGPQAGGAVDLFGTGAAPSNSSSSTGKSLQRQHAAVLPVIRALRKKIRVAPENLQYELVRDPVSSSSAAGEGGGGGGDLAERRATAATSDDSHNKFASATFGAMMSNRNDVEDDNSDGGGVKSRPMSGTRSSIGSWSDVVGVRDLQNNMNNNNNNAAVTAALAAEDGASGDETARNTVNVNNSDTNRKEGASAAAASAEERQLMLPQVRVSAGLEHLVRNKLIAYKCGHHNDKSKGDPSPFSHVRFPMHDSCGRAFFDRVEQMEEVQQLRHSNSNVAFVFGMSSLTSVFSALVFMMVRLRGKGASFFYENSTAAVTATTTKEQQQQQQQQQETAKRAIDAECSFLATQHSLFHCLYNDTSSKAHFSEVVALLRRCGLLVLFAGAMDVHRRFAEKAVAAQTILPEGCPLDKLRQATSVSNMSAAASSASSSFGGSDDINSGDLTSVQKRRMVQWFAAQSAQRIERFATLVMYHHFLHCVDERKKKQKQKKKEEESFFEFCLQSHPSVMSQLLGRIDPWDVVPTTDGGDNSGRSPEGPPPQLSHAMRRAHNLPAQSPLHPLSNATHRSKRWSQELWIEKAC